MLAILLAPILVCGYIVFQHHPYHFFRLHRFNGQLLYLSTARYGLLCTFLGFLIFSLWHHWVPDKINIPIRLIPDFFGQFDTDMVEISFNIGDAAKQEIQDILILNSSVDQVALLKAETHLGIARMVWLIQGSLVSLCVAYLWCWIARLFLLLKAFILKKSDTPLRGFYKITLMSRILNDSPVDKVLFKSFISIRGYVRICLDSREVLFGKVVSLGEPSESSGMDQEVSIIPFYLGFQDKDTLETIITEEAQGFPTITVPRDKIAYVTTFDLDKETGFVNEAKRRGQALKSTRLHRCPMIGRKSAYG